MARIVLVWGLWGPYHASRFDALKRQAELKGDILTGLSLFAASSVNRWGLSRLPDGVVKAEMGSDEAKFPLARAGSLFTALQRLRPDVALLPSYWHWSLILNISSRFVRARVVMMNETHGGTARSTGLAAWIKRRLMGLFDAALVGGTPHKRYFTSMGLRPDKVFTGYDAVDNDYFAQRAEDIRGQRSEVRHEYGLPGHYFLSLGRFAAKKNLGALFRAYRRYLDASPLKQTHLVVVGSGEEEASLRALSAKLQLPIYEKAGVGRSQTKDGRHKTESAGKRAVVDWNGTRLGNRESTIGNPEPGVHLYGFRQIDENPIFYALADALILPSLYEEWGLVVNEAMASGLPVVVSETAGCAEDLLEGGCAAGASLEDRARIEQTGLTRRLRLNGFVFSPRSPEELSRSLLLLEGSASLRALMGAESRRIVQKFSCENFARSAMLAVEAAMAPRTGRRWLEGRSNPRGDEGL
jgi:glycosyltransferase involved in cell wall biosynthesis